MNKYILGYLGAIIIANITVSIWGPNMSIFNAFVFVGLILVTRDKLHDIWSNNLTVKMGILIFLGGLISAVFGAGQIALASFLAFLVSESIDAITYHFLQGQQKIIQINGSNVLSAIADSFIFPIVAFGLPVLWLIVLGQIVAKILGGFLWSLILVKIK